MTLGKDNGTDGQTDRQSAMQYAAPPREEGHIISRQALTMSCFYSVYSIEVDIRQQECDLLNCVLYIL